MATPRAKNTLLFLLALTTIGGAALAWSQYLELIRLRAGGAGDARGDSQKRLWALEKRNHELEAEVAQLRRRGSAPDRTGPTNAAGPDGAARARDAGPTRVARRGGFLGLTTLMDNPQFAKLWTDQQKARIGDAFKPLFKSLNLSPDQTSKLESLLAEKQSSVMDALAAARSQGITDRGQIQELIQQANGQIDSQIQSLLGPDGYTEYGNYLQTMPQRNQVGQLQARLASDGMTPLQSYQVQQLTQILAQNAPSQGAGGGRGMYGPMGALGGLLGPPVTGPTISPNAVDQAGTVLTPEQLQALQQMQQEQATQQQLFSAMRQGFREQQAGATAPAATGPAATPVTTPHTGGRPGGG